MGGGAWGGLLPTAACSPGEAGLWASKSSPKARLRLGGLGVEMEPRPGNLAGEEEEEEEGEEEDHSPPCSGKGKYLLGGEGEEARIRTACQRCWEGRLGTSGSGDLELLWKTSLPKGTPEEEGLWPPGPGSEGRLAGNALWVGQLRTEPGVVLPLPRAGLCPAAVLVRVGPGPVPPTPQGGPGAEAGLTRRGPGLEAKLRGAGPGLGTRRRAAGSDAVPWPQEPGLGSDARRREAALGPDAGWRGAVARPREPGPGSDAPGREVAPGSDAGRREAASGAEA